MSQYVSRYLSASLEQNPFAADNLPPSMGYQFTSIKGVIHVKDHKGNMIDSLSNAYITRDEFLVDYEFLRTLLDNGPLMGFSFKLGQRLRLIGHFQLRLNPHDDPEQTQQKLIPMIDFFSLTMWTMRNSAAPTGVYKEEGNLDVCLVNGKKITLIELFAELGIKPSELTVDSLGVYAQPHQSFLRFDLFNTMGAPAGEKLLRDLFFKVDNYIDGEYFAQLLEEVIQELEKSKHIHAEIRLSLYGRNRTEWIKLARWFCKYQLHSKSVRWLIQIPRLYDDYRSKSEIHNFKEMLENLFIPLFEATNDPRTYPELHVFLKYVVGFDIVGDESKMEHVLFGKDNPMPDAWAGTVNPPFSYYLFYVYANLAVLNKLRQLRGFTTFSLRPHCGESGSVEHLVTAFMTSSSIAHGVQLREAPAFEYLFYLCQVGITMSPASNNALFVAYKDNPFPRYFQSGQLVSLSTDDPMQFHFMEPPLMDEYSGSYRLLPGILVQLAEQLLIVFTCHNVTQHCLPRIS